MTAIRSLLAQRNLAVLLCTATLLLKLIMPMGYMVGSVEGRITVILCPGAGPLPASLPAPHEGQGAGMAMAGHAMTMHDRFDHPAGHSDGGHGRDMPCAFAGLAAPMLAAIDPIQLALLIAFVMALGLVVRVVPRPGDAPYLRPPLRGPPALS